MATLCKEALLTGKISNAADPVKNKKTTVFCLESANQLAARIGGGASLIGAQSKASHGETLAQQLKPKIDAIKKVCAQTQKTIGLTRVECTQIQQDKGTAGNVVPIDPVVSTARFRTVEHALRRAQADTLGVAAVTEPDAPSALGVKSGMLDSLYLTALRQSLSAKINRPYLLLLNKVKSA